MTEVKKEKTYPHIRPLICSIVRLRLDDSVGMQNKVTLKPDDPRLISKTLSLLPPPATTDLVDEKISRLNPSTV